MGLVNESWYTKVVSSQTNIYFLNAYTFHTVQLDTMLGHFTKLKRVERVKRNLSKKPLPSTNSRDKRCSQGFLKVDSCGVQVRKLVFIVFWHAMSLSETPDIVSMSQDSVEQPLARRFILIELSRWKKGWHWLRTQEYSPQSSDELYL